ncbi:MAG: hypothetical protein V1871_06160, partial [Planctomycetota bacterium]
MRKYVYCVIAILFLVAFVTTFNYGGCGAAAGNSSNDSSGSSNPTSTTNPSVITNPATNVTQTTATLNGTVNPNGVNTTVYFQLGLTTSYGNTTTSQAIGSGNTSVVVSTNISGLSVNTQYNFRVVRTNSYGITYGNNQTFTTGSDAGSPPTCITGSGNNITTNSATLNGTVNPNGVATIAYFQWGSTTSYGNTTASQSIGSGTSNVSINANISGLSASTQYNFRVIGTNSYGITYGNNQTFTTGSGAGSPPTCTTNAATNVAATSATLNGTVNPNGLNVTSCYFQYGTSQSYGSQQNVSTLPGS